jgi:hypothetical protein
VGAIVREAFGQRLARCRSLFIGEAGAEADGDDLGARDVELVRLDDADLRLTSRIMPRLDQPSI